MVWATCEKCGKKFNHDEWHNEREMVHDGWTWGETHKHSLCDEYKKTGGKTNDNFK